MDDSDLPCVADKGLLQDPVMSGRGGPGGRIGGAIFCCYSRAAGDAGIRAATQPCCSHSVNLFFSRCSYTTTADFEALRTLCFGVLTAEADHLQ
jgi:hypothetical protein